MNMRESSQREPRVYCMGLRMIAIQYVLVIEVFKTQLKLRCGAMGIMTLGKNVSEIQIMDSYLNESKICNEVWMYTQVVNEVRNQEIRKSGWIKD